MITAMRVRCLSSALATLIFIVMTGPASAAGGGDPIISPAEYGQSQAQWQAQWWQWVLSIPTVSNPLADPTGELCPTGQRGRVWFLVGTNGGAPVHRHCNVPRGTALFFPIGNTQCYEDAYTPSAAACRPDLTAYINGWTVTLALDGRQIGHLNRFRGQAGPFVEFSPLDNVYADPGPVFTHAIDDGWYVMLKPMSVGEHVIHFTADDGYGYLVDVTYEISVVAL